jgi:hypothetical protein
VAEKATQDGARREQTPCAWSCVLDWNAPSIEFYRAAGAVPMEEWTMFRLTGDALTRFAADLR